MVDVGAFTVSTYRVADGTRLHRAPAGAGPTHGIRTADGQLLVADTRGNALLRYDETTLTQTGSTSVTGTAAGVLQRLAR